MSSYNNRCAAGVKVVILVTLMMKMKHCRGLQQNSSQRLSYLLFYQHLLSCSEWKTWRAANSEGPPTCARNDRRSICRFTRATCDEEQLRSAAAHRLPNKEQSCCCMFITHTHTHRWNKRESEDVGEEEDRRTLYTESNTVQVCPQQRPNHHFT